MKSFILILSILFSFNLVAQEIKSDAVYEKIIKEYTLNEDGSIEFHYYKKLKLNTHYSFNRRYGETFIVYNPEFQTLKINLAQTTQNNGNVVKTPENAFNEVLPRFAANAPFYNGLREMVVTHTGLEVGVTIELDYTITSKPGFLPGLMADEVLTESSPISSKVIIVNVAQGVKLNYKVLNIRTGPEIVKNKKHSTYTFTFNGIAENSHEAFQPADKLHLPRLIFSTKTFEEAIAFVTKQNAFSYKANQSMKNAIANLRKKKEEKTNIIYDDLDFILDVQKMVAKDINLYGVQPQYTGYNIRHAIDTWNSNGGTGCEKTLLMVSLLREAGIYAKPVVVVPSKLYDENIGCLSLIENILVMVSPLEREQMYLSALKTSGQNEIFSLNNKTLLVFEPAKQAVEYIHEKFENKLVASGSFEINEEFKITGELETLLSEKVNPYYQITTDTSIIKSFIGGGISKKDITSAEVINSAQFRTLAKFDVKSIDSIKNQGAYYFWEIPLIIKGSESWHISSLNSERISQFNVPFPINEQYSYTVSLPEGAHFINPVELTERKTEFGELLLSTSIKGNKITVKRMLLIHRTEISPQEYPAFKEMMDLWNEGNFRKLILKTP